MEVPRISLIAALSENRVIGKDNKLPWHITEDMKRFRDLTTGHTVIMGRKTFDSIGRPLPRRTNVVITRDPEWKAAGVIVCHCLDEAIKVGYSDQELFVIGGGQIYEQAMPIADRLYLTLVHTNIEGDAFFPDYSDFKKVIFKQDGESHGCSYTFLD